jgi:hypothetical protein
VSTANALASIALAVLKLILSHLQPIELEYCKHSKSFLILANVTHCFFLSLSASNTMKQFLKFKGGGVKKERRGKVLERRRT